MLRPALPDFEKPPVTEVALSMQFKELTDFRAIHLGLLWEHLGRASFPRFQEQSPVPPSFERFGADHELVMPSLQLLEIPPMPRYLFISQSGTEIVQVQQDRFTVNWRKRSVQDEYPRFEALAQLFEKQVLVFEQFLATHKLGQLVVTQAEVTYVNRIVQENEPRKLQEILSVFSGAFSDNFLPAPEEAFASFRFPLHDGALKVGRLYIDVHPEVPGEEDGALKMVLLARGAPKSKDRNGAEEFFALGRKYIVSGFASITSREAQKYWGRRDNG